MKSLIIMSLLFSTFASAAVKERKVSNSNYFVCNLEREAADKKTFKKEYHFPFPMARGESYELKGSMRWNDFKLNFSQDGTVEIAISESVKGKRVTAKKTHNLGKEPHFESFKVQVDVKTDDVVIPYHISCGPE